MTDPTFKPTEEQKVMINEIQEGEHRWAKIHEMTEKIEDKQREGAQEQMHQDLDEEKVL